MRARLYRQSTAAISVVLVALVLTPAVLLAHQYLRAASPADGDTLDRVSEEIRLTFSEPVRLAFTSVEVVGPDGPLVLGSPRTSADGDPVLVVPVEGGWHPGEFILRWSTVGADGHRTDGTFSFIVEEGAEGLPEPEPEEIAAPDEVEAAPSPTHHDPRTFPETTGFGVESPAYIGVRTLLFTSLIALLGAVALRLVVLPVMAQRRHEAMAALRQGIDRGAARLGMIAAAAFFVAALARLWAQSASIFGTDAALDAANLSATLSLQPWGTGWWLQLGAAILAIAGFALAYRLHHTGWTLAAIAALLAAVTPALSGHAVGTPGLAWIAVPADVLHMIAAGGWVGGLFALLVVGLPVALRMGPGRRGPAVSALVHGFSPTALLFAGVLVATGLISAWLHLGEISALWTSAYGRTLLLKLAIFMGVFMVGAYNFFRVRPALGEDAGTVRLRRSSTVELLFAVAVIVVTAALVAIPPPSD